MCQMRVNYVVWSRNFFWNAVLIITLYMLNSSYERMMNHLRTQQNILMHNILVVKSYYVGKSVVPLSPTKFYVFMAHCRRPRYEYTILILVTYRAKYVPIRYRRFDFLINHLTTFSHSRWLFSENLDGCWKILP